MDTTRVDRWTWAVRLYKTRSMASEACQAGHVTVNGRTAKPATKVVVGDEVAARVGERQRILEVVRVIDKRVGAAPAGECFVDHSPPPPEPSLVAPAAVRDRGAGRPTKRERRQLDRYQGHRSG